VVHKRSRTKEIDGEYGESVYFCIGVGYKTIVEHSIDMFFFCSTMNICFLAYGRISNGVFDTCNQGSKQNRRKQCDTGPW
jgi:hypothetical protein